jgi:hypothetical protein
MSFCDYESNAWIVVRLSLLDKSTRFVYFVCVLSEYELEGRDFMEVITIFWGFKRGGRTFIDLVNINILIRRFCNLDLYTNNLYFKEISLNSRNFCLRRFYLIYDCPQTFLWISFAVYRPSMILCAEKSIYAMYPRIRFYSRQEKRML